MDTTLSLHLQLAIAKALGLASKGKRFKAYQQAQSMRSLPSVELAIWYESGLPETSTNNEVTPVCRIQSAPSDVPK